MSPFEKPNEVDAHLAAFCYARTLLNRIKTSFVDNSILNLPFEELARHWAYDEGQLVIRENMPDGLLLPWDARLGRLQLSSLFKVCSPSPPITPGVVQRKTSSQETCVQLVKGSVPSSQVHGACAICGATSGSG